VWGAGAMTWNSAATTAWRHRRASSCSIFSRFFQSVGPAGVARFPCLLLPPLAKLAACMDPACCPAPPLLQVTGDAWDTRPLLKVRVLKLMFGFSAQDNMRLLSGSRGLGNGGGERRVGVPRQSRQAGYSGKQREEQSSSSGAASTQETPPLHVQLHRTHACCACGLHSPDTTS
jgi:hypothetical protein